MSTASIESIVRLAHALERAWPNEGFAREKVDANGSTKEQLAQLVHRIRSLAESDDENHARLSQWADHLTLEMSARHLANVIIPFERALGRGVREDEFMVHSHDREISEARNSNLALIAHCLRSSFNVGSILRSADALGVSSVVLTGYTPSPDQAKTTRTSLGAEASVNWRKESDLTAAIKSLRSEGYTIVALETAERATAIEDYEWPEKAALLVGNERFGFEPSELALADDVVSIPMVGVKNSLNVATCFAIAAYAFRSERSRANRTASNGFLRSRPIGFLRSRPIGFLRSRKVQPFEAARQAPLELDGEVGVIELEQGQQFEQALDSLEGFDRIWLIYHFHHNTNWKPMVLPPRGAHIKRGVFATRSPYRPNPIGMSAVKVDRIEGLRIFIRQFDLLDGTPILDIKPYLPYADSFPDSAAGWTEALSRESSEYQIFFSDLSREQLQWLKSEGLTEIENFVVQQLTTEPTDQKRKRVRQVADRDPAVFQLSYRTWRIDFKVTAPGNEQRSVDQIEVLRITSGYSHEELSNTETDRYNDKLLHLKFINHF